MSVTTLDWERLSQPTKKRFLVVAAIADGKNSLQKLSDKTGIPVSSLRRTMRVLRIEYGMDIRYINTGVSIGYDVEGFYKIEQWGLLDERFFKAHVAKTIPLK